MFVLEADGAGLKEGQKARFAIEGRPGEEYEATVSRVEPLAKTRDWQSPVKYFETTLSLAKDPGQPEAGAEGARRGAARRGGRRALDPARRALREGRQARRLPPERQAASRRSRSRPRARASRTSWSAAGLAAGDVIALRDPSAKRSQGVRGGWRAGGAGHVIDLRESLSSGVESLRHHALRSFLAMLGIIFGVGAVIAMLSIGAGAERQALEIIDAMGLRNVVVKDKRFDRENELTEIRRKSRGALEPRRARRSARRCPASSAWWRRSRSRPGRCCRPRAAPSRACSASPPTTRRS